MSNETRSDVTPTRRDDVRYGGTLVVGGLLAGCAGETGSGSTTDSTTAATEGVTRSTPATRTSAGSESYSVSMGPMGEVTFDAVPERWMAYFSTYGDMAIALGQLGGLRGFVFTENWPLSFYEHLPGVDISFDDVNGDI